MRRLLALVTILSVCMCAGSAHAQAGGPYGWTISTSNTDPFQNTGTVSGGLRTFYLWFNCSTPEPNGPGGMASAEFDLVFSPTIIPLAAIMQNGYLNAGGTTNLLLAVGGCPTGPVLAANILTQEIGPGSICFAPSVANDILGTVDCAPAPMINDMEWIGYDNTGAAPCSDGAAMCVPSGPNTSAGPDLETCADEPTQIGGNPTAQGGTPPYMYSWDPTTGLDDPTAPNPIATIATTTTYTVTVTDADNATGTDSMTLTVNVNPVADAGPDVGFCEGEGIPVGGTPTGAGGLPPYTYSWTPTKGLTNPTIANPSASLAGTYTVTVTDANGCSDSDQVTVSANPSPTADAGPDVQITSGGSAQIGGNPTASGGTPPYTYDWTPTTGLDDPAAANPTANPAVETTYTVLVTDANGCTAMAAMTVTIGAAALVVNAGPDAAICEGDAVEIGGSPSASGGTPPYTFAWTPTDGLDDPSAANPNASPAATTTYTLTVTDNDGTQESDMVMVTVSIPVADAGPDVAIDSGNSTPIGGSPTASGGTPPYTYSWTPTDGLDDATLENPTASPTVSTTYTVEITDDLGCTATDAVVVTVNTGGPLAADAGPDVAVCAGGSVEIGGAPTGSGGMPPYTYSWTPIKGLDDPAIANPTASPATTTTYTVTVTDALGNPADHSEGSIDRDQATDAVIVTVNPTPTADAGADQVIAPGGSVAIGGAPTGDGGTPPYTYSWTPTAGLDDPTAANPNASPASTTTYTVVVIDANGCEGTDQMLVVIEQPLAADAGADQAICEGESTPIGGDPTAIGGVPPYLYAWTPTTGLDDPTDANPNALPTVTTTYTVTVTDAEQTTATDMVMVTVNAPPTVNAGADVTICAGESTTLTASASGGTPPYTFNWQGLGGGASQTVSPNTTTSYTVVATDANGCQGEDTVTVTVTLAPTVDAGPDVSITAGGSTPIGGSPTASGGTPPYTYSWSPATGLDDATLANPTATPAATTTYTVTVTDANGCQGTAMMTVTVGGGGDAATRLDIIPGECPNVLDVDSDSSLKVAIVGTETFDVRDIDRDTILLEGVEPYSIRRKDVSVAFDGELCECPPDDDDEDSDDIKDLRLKFERDEIVAAAGLADLPNGEEVLLTLTASLEDGTPIELQDCVIVKIEEDDDDDSDSDSDSDSDNDGDTDGDGGGDDDGDTDGDNLARSGSGGATTFGFDDLGDAGFRLYSAGPNPFTSQTTFRFAIRNESSVRLTVYDVAGREIETLVDGSRAAGQHTLTWDARNVPSGVYFYRLTVAGMAETRKVVVAR